VKITYLEFDADKIRLPDDVKLGDAFQVTGQIVVSEILHRIDGDVRISVTLSLEKVSVQ
jgi:hypothetical protein